MKFVANTECRSERVARWKREVKPFHEHYQNWHPWFAWFPVPVSSSHKAWLEWVERKFTWGSSVSKAVYDPIYRTLSPTSTHPMKAQRNK